MTDKPKVHFVFQPPPTYKNSAKELHSSTLHGDPPPWEPQFEDVSSLSALPLLRRPLDPPPPCFSTPSPMRIKSHDFPTFRVPAVSDKLADGFHALYPHNILEGHGIYRTDWIRFLEDLTIAARLSINGHNPIRSRAPVEPSFVYRIFSPRMLGGVYDAHFGRSPLEDVRGLVQIWNECAFERRKIRVTLQVRPSGVGGKKCYALVVESL